VGLPSWLKSCVNFFTGKANEKYISLSEVPFAPSVPAETYIQQNLSIAISPIDQSGIVSSDSRLPEWFQGEIPTELLRLARANYEEPVYRQILADWVERYGGEEGRLLCRFFRRGPILRDDASTWQTLSACEARLVAPFSDLVLGIGDQLVLPLSETQSITMGWVPPGQSWLCGGGDNEGFWPFALKKGLWCAIFLIAEEQWQAVMGNNEYHFEDAKRAIGNNYFNEVQDFIQKLNATRSVDCFYYRLPTEDEWEYVLRGGPISKNQSQYHFYFARSKTDLTPVASNDLSSSQANFNGSYPAGNGKVGPYVGFDTHVGNYFPNPLGMYDMHGYLWEWTATRKSSYNPVYGVTIAEGLDRVLCGGSNWVRGDECRASHRGDFDTDYSPLDIGFRLVAVPFGE